MKINQKIRNVRRNLANINIRKKIKNTTNFKEFLNEQEPDNTSTSGSLTSKSSNNNFRIKDNKRDIDDIIDSINNKKKVCK
jgi:hypothetical protein